MSIKEGTYNRFYLLDKIPPCKSDRILDIETGRIYSFKEKNKKSSSMVYLDNDLLFKGEKAELFFGWLIEQAIMVENET